MCMAVGQWVKGNGAFVATDTRTMCDDGSYEDVGGKIVPTHSGWATGTGKKYEPFHRVLSALRDAPVPESSCDPMSAAYLIVRAALIAGGFECRSWRETGVAPEDQLHVMIVDDGFVDVDGRRWDFGVIAFENARPDEVCHGVAMPADLLDPDATRFTQAVLADLASAGEDLACRIRAAANQFANVAQVSNVMSPAMEVGYVRGPGDRGFLRGDARAIANTDPTEIFTRFQSMPHEHLPQDAVRLKWLRCAVSGQVTSASIQPAAVGPTQAQARSRCKLWNSASQSMGSGSTISLSFDSEIYDTASLHSTSSSPERITIPSGGDVGVWILVAQVCFLSNATGYRDVTIRKNGSPIMAHSSSVAVNGTDTNIAVICMVDAPSVGDYFEVRVTQTSGGALSVRGADSGSETFFSATHLW